MSLFQCENCGCVENTALSMQGFKGFEKWFDWAGIEDRKGKKICSACGPEFREWHGKFKRVFLPLGMFKTNRVGNLEHIETGEEDYRKHEIQHS